MNAAKKIAPETVTRYVGNCQICERDQKLTVDMRMVHHGYTRPGHGNIEGDCPCVGEVPYETSCDRIKSYVKSCRNQLANAQSYLTKIVTGKVTEFETTEGNWGRKLTFKSYSKYVSSPHWFDAELGAVRQRVESQIYFLEQDIAHRDARIAAWKKVPVRTVEEEAAKEQAEKDARKTERQAAKAVRDVKKAATRARVEALEARRKAARDVFKARLMALAAMPPSGDRDAMADKLYDDMMSKKARKEAYIWGPSDLHCPELFVQVGLATISRGENNRNGHGDVFADFHRTNKTT